MSKPLIFSRKHFAWHLLPICERMGVRLMDLDQEMDRLAELIALRAQRKMGIKPQLRAVGSANAPDPFEPAAALAAAQTSMDVLVRESHCRMIRHLRHRWGYSMQVLIDQACFGLAGIEQLPDMALIQLHQDLERAQDCIRDGVSFEDAGILRPQFG